MALLQECLKKVNVKIKQITYRPAYDEGIHTNNMLNLLLSMIPNRNKTLSYAHGKLICGTCSSIYNKGRSAGEELGLHISFDYDNLLTARTLTFAEEDKVKRITRKILRYIIWSLMKNESIFLPRKRRERRNTITIRLFLEKVTRTTYLS